MSHVLSSVRDIRSAISGKVAVTDQGIDILDAEGIRENLIDDLVWTSTFGEGDAQAIARWLIRVIAPAMGAWPASIQELYMASARGDYHHVTTPAINLRTLTYDLAQTIFRAADQTETSQILFELARSEMGYTEQRPGEYASSVLAAAIRHGWQGPVMIQGDHYQANAKKYADDPEAELTALEDLSREAIAAGYGNIDVDASTLVDLSLPTPKEQQKANALVTARLTQVIREAEPESMTVSIGGEIGEVGGRNSTEEDLETFWAAYQDELSQLGGDLTPISKISIQTGTSHGGVVLADGSIAQVAVSFDTLAELGKTAKRLGMGGAVQHGASTLPESAFSKFRDADAVEVHLATAFQNAILDSKAFPSDLWSEMEAFIHEHFADEKKDDETDAQFVYKTRKKVLGPFTQQVWEMPKETKDTILAELQPKFENIFQELGVAGRSELVKEYIKQVDVDVPMPDAAKGLVAS